MEPASKGSNQRCPLQPPLLLQRRPLIRMQRYACRVLSRLDLTLTKPQIASAIGTTRFADIPSMDHRLLGNIPFPTCSEVGYLFPDVVHTRAD